MGGKSARKESTSGLSPEYKSLLDNTINNATALHAAGLTGGQVAGMDAATKAGLDSLTGAAQHQADVATGAKYGHGQLGKIASGEEIVPTTTGATDAIKAAALNEARQKLVGVRGAASATGSRGSGRGSLNREQLAADTAAKTAGLDYADLQARRAAAQSAAGGLISGAGATQAAFTQPGSTLVGVGDKYQSQSQAELDAPLKNLQGYINTFAPFASKTTKSSQTESK